MLYKLKHIRDCISNVYISSSEGVMDVIHLVINRRDGFLINKLLILFIPFIELTNPIQSNIISLSKNNQVLFGR